MDKPVPVMCKCGGKPRVRYKKPFAWVECSRKDCQVFSGYITDGYGLCSAEAVKEAAVILWNQEVRKNG